LGPTLQFASPGQEAWGLRSVSLDGEFARGWRFKTARGAQELVSDGLPG
jgi:hypothetical protein